MALEVGGQSIELDEEGYLVDLASWTPEIATALATGEDFLSIQTSIRAVFLCGNVHRYHIRIAILGSHPCASFRRSE